MLCAGPAAGGRAPIRERRVARALGRVAPAAAADLTPRSGRGGSGRGTGPRVSLLGSSQDPALRSAAAELLSPVIGTGAARHDPRSPRLALALANRASAQARSGASTRPTFVRSRRLASGNRLGRWCVESGSALRVSPPAASPLLGMETSSPPVAAAFHGCRSGTASDRAPPSACFSSDPGVGGSTTGTPARVSTQHCGFRPLNVSVADDAVGGVDREGAGGSGIRDRVMTLGGRLVLNSPAAGETRPRAELPQRFAAGRGYGRPHRHCRQSASDATASRRAAARWESGPVARVCLLQTELPALS